MPDQMTAQAGAIGSYGHGKKRQVSLLIRR